MPTILIVDDQLTGRKTLEALLMGQAYDLLLASNGFEALTLAQEFQPDLILLDTAMPDLDGFEVCRQLRADPILGEVPIMMVATTDDRHSRRQAFEVGADEFIVKPFDAMDLRMRVRTITRLNRYRHLMTERAQRHLAETEQAFQNKLISHIAHELRTPLAVITLLVGNLETLYPKLDDTKRLKMIHDMRGHTRLLSELVENTLNITQLEYQPTPADYRPINLGQLTREEAAKQLPLAEQKGQTIDFQGQENLEISGHQDKLRQVVRNLLHNAIKYSPQAGRISCEWAYISSQNDTLGWPNLPPTNHWAGLRVNNNGPTIAAADLPYLFDRFYRVQAQSHVPGTGLGLSIVKEVVAQHHGHVGVCSTVGAGTTFAIYLPI